MSLQFITNRTDNDVSYAKQNQGDASFLLGSMNYTDLNRIESNTKALADKLKEYGYDVNITVTEWYEDDVPYLDEVNRIRTNVDALQTGFYTLPDWRDIVYSNTLDFNQANAMELDLQRVYVWLQRMIASFWYAGEIYSGEEQL